MEINFFSEELIFKSVSFRNESKLWLSPDGIQVVVSMQYKISWKKGFLQILSHLTKPQILLIHGNTFS